MNDNLIRECAEYHYRQWVIACGGFDSLGNALPTWKNLTKVEQYEYSDSMKAVLGHLALHALGGFFNEV